MELFITHHAYDRARERFSFARNSLERAASKAYEKGLRQATTRGRLKKYLDKLWFDHKNCNNIRIYGEVIFFFAGETLVTLYQIPYELRKYVKVNKA